ncbi:hypothetical protein [Mucilaginibacter sp. UYCu711]|uniref:hypothetical protein n=1 Tax=Mucilaginibacter sp. UYCu711 TaxID=3156339 RepID=UPI003D248E2D
MKAIISKILAAGTIVATLSLSAVAGTPYQKMKKDTGKMAKMDKKMDKKMDSKMDSKMDKKMDKMSARKMAKDTGKMKKM